MSFSLPAPGKISILTVMMLMASALVFAQGGATTASLTGRVSDPSGAVIPGADVTVRHNATGTLFQAVTGTDGNFTVPALNPGIYTVTVALMGFKTAQLPDVQVIAATPATVRVTLEVGTLEETVVVTGATEILQTQSAAVTTTLTTQQISALPTATRNTLDFVTMLPGVNTTGTLRTSTVMGLRQNAINITIDGINVQDNFQKGGDGFFAWIFPRMDAVEEVTVSTANPGAESSGQGAVQIRFSTRSGTNRFSGSVYDYMRRAQWNTNYWFNEQKKLPTDKLNVDTYGFRVGGPVVKDRLFYFLNMERFRLPSSNVKTRTVLTPDAVKGLFTYGGGTVNLYTLAAANGQTATADPTILKILNDIQATTSQGTLGETGLPITKSFSWTALSEEKDPFDTVRIDFNLSSKHRIGFTTYIQAINRVPDQLNAVEPAFPGFPTAGNTVQNRNNWSVNLRSTLTSTMVNELRVGRTGGTVSFYTNVTTDDYKGWDGFAINFPIGTSPYMISAPSSRHVPALTAEDSLNWLKGKHSVNIGGSFTQLYMETVNYRRVPGISLGVTTGDPAAGMFTTANFPGASTTDISNAQSLYSLLTGRVSSINGTAYKSAEGKYVYQGDTLQQVRQQELGFFVQDAWRMRQDLTVNFGVRYELQLPFVPQNLLYAKIAEYNQVWGVSGVDASGNPNLFKPGVQTGVPTQYIQYNKGDKALDTDYNNFAPSAGVAWRPAISGGVLRAILSSDPVFRAGYSLSFIRDGFDQITSLIGANPGASITATRSQTNGNLVKSNSELPVLFSNKSQLGPPSFPETPTYPYTGQFTESANIYAPNTQTPKAHSFNVGFQRTLDRNTAIEFRYVATRQRNTWVNGGRNMNEINLTENGFLKEFKLAQANLQANIAAGRGANFKYYGAGTGTSPLPTYLAFFTGLGGAAASDPASYPTTTTTFASTTFVNQLALFNPNPTGAASSLMGVAAQRTNAIAAGVPANFFYVNPGQGSGGAWITGRPEDSLNNNYDALQIEFRRRLSGGLLAQGSYQWVARSEGTTNYTLRQKGEMIRVAAPTHVFKVNWVYELPFGQGRRFGSGVGRAMNMLIGGWTFDGTGRLQSGNRLNFGNVLLVGMTDEELRKAYKLRFQTDAAGVNRAYMLPQDIIDNTIKALSTSATSPTGYGTLGPPSGRYIAPINASGCINEYTGSCGLPKYHYVFGPNFVRFDMSLGKRIDITKRVFAEMRVELLNVFDNVNFFGTTGTGTTQSSYEVTTAYRDTSNTQDPGGRLLQLSWRVSW